MKLKIVIFSTIILLLLGIPNSIININGKEHTAEAVSTTAKGEQALNEYIEKQLNDLDLTQLEEYIDDLTAEQKSIFDSKGVKQILTELSNGEFKLNYSSYISMVVSYVFSNVIRMLPTFALVTAICIICGVFKNLQSGFENKGTSKLISYVSYSSIILVLFAELIKIISASYSATSSMQAQIELVFPILLTLMALSGGTVSVAVFQPAVAFLSVVIVKIVMQIVFPIAVLIIVLNLVSNLNDEIKLKNFCDFFKEISKWSLGITLTAFTVFFTIQGIASSGFDGAAFKAIKYAINSSVPIVGGFLSGGFDLVMGSSIIIKNSLGVFSVLLLVGAIATPIVTLVAFVLLLKLICGLVEPIGDSEVCTMLTELCKNVGYFIAGILSVAFMYILMIFLVICSTNCLV